MTVSCDCCFVLSSVDQTVWLTALSTAILVLVVGSVVAMLIAAENRRAEELTTDRQPKYHRQEPARGTGSSGDSR